MTRVQVARWVLPVIGCNIVRTVAAIVYVGLDR